MKSSFLSVLSVSSVVGILLWRILEQFIKL